MPRKVETRAAPWLPRPPPVGGKDIIHPLYIYFYIYINIYLYLSIQIYLYLSKYL